MYDYALIIHPTNEELLHRYEPGMKNRPRHLVKKILEWMSPFKAAEIEGLNSHLGRKAKGALVMCPLLLEQMITLSPHKVMKLVTEAMLFAKKELNPKLIGLTAYTAFSGNKGMDLAKMIDLPLTIGSNYTLAMVPESIFRAANLMEIEIEKANMLVLGATTSFGRYCLLSLSHFVSKMFINSYNEEKLNIFLSTLPQEKRKKLQIVHNPDSVLDKIEIMIVATDRISGDLDINKIKPGAVVFDASYPRKIVAKLRDDILVIDGVSIKPPGNVNFNFDFGLPTGLCYPCMAEPMTLALERKFETYSLGKGLDIARIREIVHLAAKHGFEINGLTSQERAISSEEIVRIRHNSLEERKKRRGLLWR